MPGDAVIADDDGVVVVRRKDAADVVTKGEKRHADEEGKRKQLAEGKLGLDMYNMREPLAKAGLVYIDEAGVTTDVTMRLRTLLGDPSRHGCAEKRRGQIRYWSRFDFVDYSPTNKGFKPMVREAAFDVSEMAIVTYLMAKSAGKPMVLLPDVVVARFQHGYALYNSKHGTLIANRPPNGKRVGIRSFSTTTGAWLRGILANDHGVDLDSINWVTFEDAHVAEYKDTTKRAPAGKEIVQMLIDGELDAVLGEKSDHAGSETAVRRCRRGGEGLVRKAQGGADQPYGGGQSESL